MPTSRSRTHSNSTIAAGAFGACFILSTTVVPLAVAAPTASPTPASPSVSLPAPAPAPRPAASSTPAVPSKVFGMPVPASAAAATSDDAMLAWAIKHGTAAERRDIAGSIGVTYPAAAAFLGTTCDRGHGYAGVWVVNFGNTPARWNVTLDGVGYAGAQVRPASHDYGALGVPDGRHTLAFVDPRTGAVAAKIATDLHCGTPAGGTRTSGWSPTGPVEDGSIQATHPSSTPPAPAKRASSTPPGVGPVVETDHVSSDRDPGVLVVSFLGAAGALLGVRRRLRRAR